MRKFDPTKGRKRVSISKLPKAFLEELEAKYNNGDCFLDGSEVSDDGDVIRVQFSFNGTEIHFKPIANYSKHEDGSETFVVWIGDVGERCDTTFKTE